MKHSNLALVEGEVYMMENEPYLNIPRMQTTANKILASTADLDGVPKLERKWFVKPVDIQKKATEIFESSHLCLSTDFIIGYRMGYTDNKAEFTRGEMFSLVVAVQNKELVSFDDFEKYMNKLQPLSLPKSITLNDDNEIVSVDW